MVLLLTPLNSPVAFRALREYFHVLVLHFPWGCYGYLDIVSDSEELGPGI